MATSFTIEKIHYGNLTAVVQNWRFEYKLFSALTWTLISASTPVNTDGTLQASPPLTVTGLTPGQTYMIRASNNCESPPVYFVQYVNT